MRGSLETAASTALLIVRRALGHVSLQNIVDNPAEVFPTRQIVITKIKQDREPRDIAKGCSRKWIYCWVVNYYVPEMSHALYIHIEVSICNMFLFITTCPFPPGQLCKFKHVQNEHAVAAIYILRSGKPRTRLRKMLKDATLLNNRHYNMSLIVLSVSSSRCANMIAVMLNKLASSSCIVLIKQF